MQLGEGPRAWRSAVSTAALVALLTATLCSAANASARKLQVMDAAHLQLTSGGGNNALDETGRATGTLPGTVTVLLVIHTYTASSSFTIETKAGSISGKGTAALKTGKGAYASFGGAVSITRATGKYSHASGKGDLYGTINRRTDAMTVTVTGELRL